MSPPKKKRKTTTKPSSALPPTRTPESTPIPSLPDDLMLSCLARLSRLHYPTLSLVSKRFRSLLTSPELYKSRSLLNRMESCLYVCLQFNRDSNSNPRWFTLCRKPDQTLTNKKKKKKKSSGFVLAALPIPHSPPAHTSGLVSVGSNIYSIGGPINDSASASVSILDCQSHTWHEAPSLQVERSYAAANVFDEKVYVAGGCKDRNSSNWMEVFDPKTQIWEPVLSPLKQKYLGYISRSAVIDGKIYIFGSTKGVAYKPKEDRWETIEQLSYLDLGWEWLSYSVIDNVLYCYSNLEGIKWYDTKVRLWKRLIGLVELPNFAHYARVSLADYGGKMVVFWDKYLPSSGYKEKMIWCAEITLERCNGDEIWGNVEWCDGVLPVPTSYDLVKVIAVTL